MNLITPAQAYIDPGTTGLILGGGLLAPIIGAFTTFLVALGFKRVNKYVKLILSVIVLLLIVGGGGVYLHKKNAEELNKKVLILGVDALDPQITRALMDEGKLPNFKKLSDQGSFQKLLTSHPPETPVAWTNIATGVNPGEHGLFDFVVREPGSYIPKLSVSNQSRNITGVEYLSPVGAKQWWKNTSEASIATRVYRWPISFPADEISGEMLSGLGVPDIRGFLSGYSYYAEGPLRKRPNKPEHLIEVVIENDLIKSQIYGPMTSGAGDKINTITTPFTIEVGDNEVLLKVGDDTHKLTTNEWSKWIRVKFELGFLKNITGIFKAYVTFTSPFQMYVTSIQIDPQSPIVNLSHPKDFSRELAEEIGDYYTLGMPEETAGLIDDRLNEEAFLSQIREIESERDKMFWHGFEKFQREGGIYAFIYDSLDRLQHMFWETDQINPEIEAYYIAKDKLLGKILDRVDEQTEIMIISDHGFASFDRAVNINTWLYEQGFLHLTKEPSDSNPGGLYEYVDWSKTKAYSMGFTSIYLNLKNREPEGIVEDKQQVIKEIKEKLLQLTDNNEPVVHNVYRAEDIYSGDQLRDAPDLVVGFKPGYRMDWEAPVGGTTKEVVYDNTRHWRGDHLVDPSFVPGVFVSSFRTKKEIIEQTDVAPTIMSLLGQKNQEEYEGESVIK